ncbi:MAG: hypothetical protein IPH12_00470 [Saprospirales bacterium]|nr:hypothetical protein [Saprospirales bacterium]MBK8923903.1 hypothetical protein [Saprospirales bacterium]
MNKRTLWPARRCARETVPGARRLFFFWAGGLALLLTACRPPAQPAAPAAYHWQTRLALQPAESRWLDSLGARRLYVKFIDIALEGQAIRPYALLELADTAGLAGKTVVPCVFIANSVFQDISAEKIDWLAQQTTRALLSVGAQFPEADFPEYQFDCDWTPSTRAAFFSFLARMRAHLPQGARLSATIRLHQYKFPQQTGVPPADRGMLMLYNTGDIDDPEETNSIFQPDAAEKYLHGAAGRYPLPLDLALPVFSWALVYRDGELWKIIPNAGAYGGPNTVFRIQTATFLGGHYLRPGDLVRVEAVDSALLRRAAAMAARLPLAGDAVIAFYHLDTATVRHYPARFLRSVCETIHNNR